MRLAIESDDGRLEVDAYGMVINSAMRAALIATIVSGWAAPALADDLIYLNGKPCGAFCQAWMGVASPERHDRLRDDERPTHASPSTEQVLSIGQADTQRRPRAAGDKGEPHASHVSSKRAKLRVRAHNSAALPLASNADDALRDAQPRHRPRRANPTPIPPSAPARATVRTEDDAITTNAPKMGKSKASKAPPIPGKVEASEPAPVGYPVAAFPTADDAAKAPPKTDDQGALVTPSAATHSVDDISKASPANVGGDKGAPAADDNHNAPRLRETTSVTPADKQEVLSAPLAVSDGSRDSDSAHKSVEAPAPARSTVGVSPQSLPDIKEDAVGASGSRAKNGEPAHIETSGVALKPSIKDKLATAIRPKLTPPAVMIVLAEPDIKALSDLNNKSVVIAGVSEISRADVSAAFAAAGAAAVQLTEGSKDDIDGLIAGQVSAVIVALRSPAKAAQFPQIPGFKLLLVPVADFRGS